MLFNSYLFIFIFLPVVLAVFYASGRFIGSKAAMFWLVCCSFYFYILWDPHYWWVLTATIIANYLIGTAILSKQAKPGKRLLIWLGVLVNIAFLAWFKVRISPIFTPLPSGDAAYAAVFNNTNEILIPLAISFITFQQIVFLVDCYKNRCEATGFLDYALFISFFPQLVMGPIVHQREIIPQFNNSAIYRFNSSNFSVGLSIFVVGLFKKSVLADGIAETVNQVYLAASMGEQVSLIDAWVAAVGFTFQLYFDFSGYADMAIGVAKMLNINLPINFDSPLTARNRFEHWRRWHITFSEFMKNHVYMPLVRNKHIPLGKYSALMVSTFLSGLWHGISLSFVIWGLIQGAMMVASHAFKKILKSNRSYSSWFPNAASIITTFIITALISVLFRSGDLSAALVIYKGVIGLNGILIPEPIELALNAINPGLVTSITAAGSVQTGAITARFADMYYMAAFLLVVFCLPTTKQYFRKYWTALDQRPREHASKGSVPFIRFSFSLDYINSIIISGMLLISIYTMLVGTSRFIYYQF